MCGQYWYPINITKGEFITAHALGSGLKLSEQVGSHPGTAAALLVLLAAMPEQRGGGDLDKEHCPICARTIGRWAGDQVAILGDYAEDGDIPGVDCKALFEATRSEEVETWTKRQCKDSLYRCSISGDPHYGMWMRYKVVTPAKFRDISADVAHVLEVELHGHFAGSGWRNFEYDHEEQEIL
jgi:hypothetical protein